MSEQTTCILTPKNLTNEIKNSLSQCNSLSLQLRHHLHDLAQPLTVLSATLDLIEADYHEQEDLDHAREAIGDLFRIVAEIRNLAVVTKDCQKSDN
jgi:signal transduction histidine kinase